MINKRYSEVKSTLVDDIYELWLLFCQILKIFGVIFRDGMGECDVIVTIMWKSHERIWSFEWLGFSYNCEHICVILIKQTTDSTKINRPGHNIRMYWTNFRQPKQHIFGKSLIEVRGPYLYASFGTLYAKIGLLLEAQWVFEVCLNIDN